MLFKNRKLYVLNFALVLALLGGLFGVASTGASTEIRSEFSAGNPGIVPQLNISTPPNPVGMKSRESKLVKYSLTESGNISGVITSRTYQFFTQYDIPISEPMGPYPAHININPLETTDWNELVYLPEGVFSEARSIKDYAIVLKTTFKGKSSSGADFSAQASLLLLLPPANFGKALPVNGAVEQPTNQSLQWNSSVGAIDYEYCFDTIDNNSCDTDWTGTYWLGTYDTSAALQDLPSDTTFYWQVRANNMAGTAYADSGNWWSFTTCSTSQITVTNTNDSGAGSLRQAIADICPGGIINFDSLLSGQTIALSSTLVIDKDLTIDGSGFATKITLNGGGQHRILKSLSPAQVIINNLGFSSAFAIYGGAVYNTGNLTIKNSLFSDNAASNGAAIYNEGSLNLVDSIVSGNSAANQGGGIFNSANATLMITNSTFQENSAADGGGIITAIGSQTTITGSSFYNNTASSTGGGIFIFPGTVSVTNSTFFGNSANQGGAIGNSNGTLTVNNSSFSANISNDGGSIANGGILNYSNTILANSISTTDCVNYGSIGTNANNLVENNATSPNNCGTPELTADPILGSLADNGGSTFTMALLPGSPAIDAGDDASCPAIDQRGVSRPQGSRCDIGAYEVERSLVEVKIAGNTMGNYIVPSGERTFPRYGINSGPVHVVSTNGKNIFTSQRAKFRNSFNEVIGYPANQLTTDYWFTSYDDVGMLTYLVIGNPHPSDTALVNVYIAGNKMNNTPYSIAPGERIYPRYGINAGPVHVVSTNNVNIFTSERVKFGDSFNEVMGYPGDQLTSDYWFTSYDNVGMLTYLVIGNPHPTDTAQVDVYIAGNKMNNTPYLIAPGQRIFPRFATNAGPVHVVSVNNVDIFTSERSKFKQSFNEVMGHPGDQLATNYWFTSYDDAGMLTYLVIGNPHTTLNAEVDVYIAGVKVNATPYVIAPGQRIFPRYGINAGPVHVVSTNNVNIFTSERSKYLSSFNEIIGIANNQLTTGYWFTSYDDVGMTTYLVVASP